MKYFVIIFIAFAVLAFVGYIFASHFGNKSKKAVLTLEAELHEVVAEMKTTTDEKKLAELQERERKIVHKLAVQYPTSTRGRYMVYDFEHKL